MILYVDETESDEYFVVAGVLFSDPTIMEMAYKQFKKRAADYIQKSSIRVKVFTEFKSTLLDKKYINLKNLMMDYVSENAEKVVFGVHKKHQKKFPQEEKEMAYIHILSKIVSAMSEPVDIVFDKFNIANFDNGVVNIVSQNDKCGSICPGDSQLYHGLQFADNVCSAIRHKFYDVRDLGSYDIIAHFSNII